MKSISVINISTEVNNMIHMELAPSTLLGLCLAMAGIFLYFIRIKKKKVSRDYDLFFSSVGFLCGGILIFQGWRLDPILLLCQMMSGVTAIFFITETLWLRNIQIKNQNNNFDIYQNMFSFHNDTSHLKQVYLNKRNFNLINHKELIRNKKLSAFIKNRLTIDYTLPIDYY